MELKARNEKFEFLIIENEQIRENEQLSRNAIYISRILNCSSELITKDEESQIIRMLLVHGKCLYSDIVAKDNRISKRLTEIALWRLVHFGKISMNLKSHPISYDSIVCLSK